MKKLSFFTLLLTLTVFLCGCRSFFALSISKKSDGGIYRICDREIRQIATLPTVNYLIRNKNFFYATLNRIPGKKGVTGAVAVLESDKNHLKVRQTVSAGGRSPCHLTLSPDGNFLYAANYSSGNISEFHLRNGLISGKPRLIRHTGKSITPRQKSPHPHFVGFSPDGSRLFASDLGTDEIYVYNYLPGKGLQLPCKEKLKLPAGSGPRHLLFSPCGKILYTANELNSTASSFVKTNGKWQICKTVSTLIPGTLVRNSPGAIKSTADGRFFFITNRGHDSIAFFKTSGNGNFNLLEVIPSPGKFPSDILLLDNETRLAVSHLKSGTVHFFKLDKQNRKITAENNSRSVPQAIALCR